MAVPVLAGEMRTFSPLAALLPGRVTPELFYLEAKFASLASYGISARLLAGILPLGRRLRYRHFYTHTRAVQGTGRLSGAGGSVVIFYSCSATLRLAKARASWLRTVPGGLDSIRATSPLFSPNQ